MNYIAIIGDFVESRAIGGRATFQQRLVGLLEETSRRARGLVSPYTITLGDEFQAVYSRCETVIEDVVSVVSSVYPHKLRIAVGVGRIVTRINRESAIGMDGSAFHVARDVLEKLKGTDETVLQISVASPRNGAAVELANDALRLVAEMSKTWKANTWTITSELLSGSDVEPIAELLSITPRGVYKNMRTNGIRAVVHLCGRVASLLSDEVEAR